MAAGLTQASNIPTVATVVVITVPVRVTGVTMVTGAIPAVAVTGVVTLTGAMVARFMGTMAMATTITSIFHSVA